MARAQRIDADVLQAALVGFQHRRDEVEAKITELRSRIGTRALAARAPAAPLAPRKRRISAAGRKRIADAQKKRWTAVRKAREQAAAPRPPAAKPESKAKARKAAVRKPAMKEAAVRPAHSRAVTA